MVRWLIQLSTRLRILAAVIAAVVLAVGFTQLRTMPVDVFPEFNPPLVEVQTEALGLSATEVESLITVPMEADLLNGVAWMDHIYSESVAGLSSILMVFEPGTDAIQARQMVQERLTQAHALPNVSKPPLMLQPMSSNSRVMMVGFSSDELSLLDIGVLARWNIKPRLLGVPGVANVSIWGHRDRQLQVQVDPTELNANGVRLNEIVKTSGEALWVSPLTYLESSKPGTGGWIDTPNQRLGIRHLLPIASPADLEKVSIVNHPNLLLGNVASVVEDHQQLIGDATVNGAPGLLMVIEKSPSANTLEVTAGVEEVLDNMRAGLKGVEIDTSLFHPANYIEAMTNNLTTSLTFGLALALIVLFLFLWNWRTALVGLIVIPVSLAAAGVVLHWRGATLNVMTIAGLLIALGVIIDDVVIDMENISRRLRAARAGNAQTSNLNVIFAASLETRGSVIYGTLILLLVVMPVVLMQGLAGLFFTPLVTAYIVAILTSLAVALLITPGLTLLFMANSSAAPGRSPLMQAFESAYNGLAGLSVRGGAYGMMGLALILAVVGGVVLYTLPQSFVPSFQQTDLRIDWDAEPGTSPNVMMSTIEQVSAELSALGGVDNVSAHVGRAETGDQKVGINSASLWVSLNANANYDQTVNEIRAITDGYPGHFQAAQTYLPARLAEALLGPEADITVRVYGVDLTEIHEKAVEIAGILSTVNGVETANVADQIMEDQIEIAVDLEAAEQYGILPGDVRRQATTLVSGLHVGSLFEDQKVFDVVVWAKPELRDDMSDIENMLIDTPDGAQVPLKELASVSIIPTPLKIQRDAVSRYADVAITTSGRSAAAVTTDIRSALEGVTFPLEARAEVLGESLARQAARQRTLVLIVTSLVGIYLLVQAAFGGWRLAGGVLLACLMALSGGAIGALLMGGGLSLGVLFGLLAILGIAVRNSLAMIRHIQQLEDDGEAVGPELVQRGARERSGAVFMTALVTAVAVLPLIFLGSIPGHEILRPMSIVLLFGLITSTLATLLVIPAMYARLRPEPDPENIALSADLALGAAD